MFRLKRGVNADYAKQGYVFFVSLRYKKLPPEQQRRVLNLCLECGGENYMALFDFVTTDTTATAITMRYPVSRSTLYRAVKRYYERFPDAL